MRHRVPAAALLAALLGSNGVTLVTAAWSQTRNSGSSSSSAFLRPATNGPSGVTITASSPSASSLKGTSSASTALRRQRLLMSDTPNNEAPEEEECAQEDECEIDWSQMPGMGDDDEGSSGSSSTNGNGNSPSSTASAASANMDENAQLQQLQQPDVEHLRALLERQFQLDSAPEVAKANMQELERYSNSSPQLHYDDFDVDNSDGDDDEYKVKDVSVGDKTSVNVASSTTASTATAASTAGTSATMGSTNVDFTRRRLEMQWGLEQAADECDVYQPVTCGGHACADCSGKGVCPCRFCRGTGQLYLKATATTMSSSPFVSCAVCSAAGYEACRPCQGSGWIADWTDIGVRVGGLLPK